MFWKQDEDTGLWRGVVMVVLDEPTFKALGFSGHPKHTLALEIFRHALSARTTQLLKEAMEEINSDGSQTQDEEDSAGPGDSEQ